MLALAIRVTMACAYMRGQVERLAREGLPGYRICAINPLAYSAGRGLAITVTAKRPEPDNPWLRDGYHYIEIDYPWIPILYEPTHRI
jgi:hypothetical protein